MCLLTWIVCFPGAAAAEARLRWLRHPGAEACPDEASLQEVLRARLGEQLAYATAAGTQLLEGEVMREGPRGHRVVIRLRAANGSVLGERALADPDADCRALAEAAALTMALLIDANRPPSGPPTAREVPDSAAELGSRPHVAAPRSEVVDGQEAFQREESAVIREADDRFELEASALASFGLLPPPAVHAQVRAGVALAPRYALALELVGFGGASERVGGDSRGRARFSPFYAALTVGRELVRSPRAGLAAGLGILAGAVFARGSGFSERDYERRAALAAAIAQLRADVRLWGPLHLALSVTGGLPFLRARFVAIATDGRPRTLARTAPAFATVALGFALRF